MNKKGQTLILFVILIPLLLGLLAFVVDVSLIVSKTENLKGVTKMIIESVYEDVSLEEIKVLFLENDIPVENLEVDIKTDAITIQNEYEIDSIFGSVIGLSSYSIRVQMTGTIQEDQVIFE